MAHVIPNGFIRPMKGDGKYIDLVKLDDPGKTRKVQSARWDRTILCQSCEARFATLDAYGICFFRDENFDYKVIIDDEVPRLEVAGVDSHVLKRFLIFVAWRIGISKQTPFASVNLGAQLEVLRELIISESACVFDQFPTVIKKYLPCMAQTSQGQTLELRARDFMLDPCIVDDWFGRRVLQFYLADYKIYMAVDAYQNQGFWESRSLGVEREIVVVLQRLSQSSEVALIRDKLGC